eukprot:2226111-Prymnesium_polylepis.3
MRSSSRRPSGDARTTNTSLVTTANSCSSSTGCGATGRISTLVRAASGTRIRARSGSTAPCRTTPSCTR